MMVSPRGKSRKALDLFCGAGGASIGLKQAGFDVIVGIDINKNCGKRYPYDFILADSAQLRQLDHHGLRFRMGKPTMRRILHGVQRFKSQRQRIYRPAHPYSRYDRESPVLVYRERPQRADASRLSCSSGPAVGLENIQRLRQFEFNPDLVYPQLLSLTSVPTLVPAHTSSRTGRLSPSPPQWHQTTPSIPGKQMDYQAKPRTTNRKRRWAFPSDSI